MNIHDFYKQVWKIWRAKRHQQFLDIVKPTMEDTMLDIGGYPLYWTSNPMPVKEIDCVNLEFFEWPEAEYPEHHFNSKVGNGCDLDLADNAYDISFSNSVMEHVGDLDAQRAFAKESMRVGKRFWLQTPAYECPLEPHFVAPFIHWLPKSWRRAVARYFTVWGLTSKPSKQEVREFVDYTRLLTKKEMKEIFPTCTIITERLFFILPKSYIVHNCK